MEQRNSMSILVPFSVSNSQIEDEDVIYKEIAKKVSFEDMNLEFDNLTLSIESTIQEANNTLKPLYRRKKEDNASRK